MTENILEIPGCVDINIKYNLQTTMEENSLKNPLKICIKMNMEF